MNEKRDNGNENQSILSDLSDFFLKINEKKKSFHHHFIRANHTDII